MQAKPSYFKPGESEIKVYELQVHTLWLTERQSSISSVGKLSSAAC